jgi:transcriptional regulator with XRE-family HTH domain
MWLLALEVSEPAVHVSQGKGVRPHGERQNTVEGGKAVGRNPRRSNAAEGFEKKPRLGEGVVGQGAHRPRSTRRRDGAVGHQPVDSRRTHQGSGETGSGAPNRQPPVKNSARKLAGMRCEQMGLGIALKYYRIRAGVQQKELARLAGVSPSYLSLVESERRPASLDFLSRVSRILKIPLELLMIEAKEQEGQLSAEQSELFSRAKALMLLAAKLERGERGSADAASKNEPSSIEHSQSRSSRAAPRRAPSGSRGSSAARRVALQSNTVPTEKRRRKAQGN